MDCRKCNTPMKKSDELAWCPKCGILYNLEWIKKLIKWVSK